MMVLFLATMLVACKKENEVQPSEVAAVEESTSTGEEVTTEADSQTEAVVEEDNKEETKEEAEVIPANFANKTSLDDEMFDFYASADWQKAYKKILDEKTSPYAEAFYSMQYYCLDDIDKDGTPEFMYFYGTCEADYQLDVYTYNGKEAVFVDTIGAGHCQLYSYPGENGLIQYFAHMGYASAYCSRLENGKLIPQDTAIFEEDINEKLMNDWDADYTPLADIIPGVKAISYMQLSYTYGLLEYGGIKKIDWGITDAEFEKMVNDIVSRGKELYAVNAEEYFSMDATFTVGTKTIDDLLDDPLIVGDTNGERVVKDIFYGDFNHDGQLEALAVLEESEELTRAFLILSYQNGVVYGYVSRKLYSTDYEVYDDKIYELEKENGHLHKIINNY